MVLARPAALFDPYAAIAALDEVVNVTKEKKEKKDERVSRYEIVLRQCRPLLHNPCLQQVLKKLVASKEEAEVARSLDGRIRLHTRGVVPISALDHLRRGSAGCVERWDTSRAFARTSVKHCEISESDLF